MDLIKKYFRNLSAPQIKQLHLLDFVYHEWNERINVISRKDIDSLYEKHVLHSLSIAAITDIAAGTNIIDIGTGGGFPGISLDLVVVRGARRQACVRVREHGGTDGGDLRETHVVLGPEDLESGLAGRAVLPIQRDLGGVLGGGCQTGRRDERGVRGRTPPRGGSRRG